MDLEQARFNMVYQQIKPNHVLNEQVLKLMMSIPRENFVPVEFQKVAYSDTFIPLPYQQCMLTPSLIGRILQITQISPQDRVLQIGTGSGYLTALLSKLAKKVTGIEIHESLFNQTKQNLEQNHSIQNVHLNWGDGLEATHSIYNQSYDVIILTGSLSYLPTFILSSLNKNGKIFHFIGSENLQSAVLLEQEQDNEWKKNIFFETSIPFLTAKLPLNEGTFNF
ncbi:MAG: Protein-L-isoaspartate(D-aspartate) O-methyltransferase [Francisellaceae bacterium]|nr:Protein-L-isoaspartate(D-aspartate) O-methyltransferase [Francisellaceae bacterium]